MAQEERVVLCQAVAKAQISLDLGIIQKTLVALESELRLLTAAHPLHLHGVSGPMRLVKLLSGSAGQGNPPLHGCVKDLSRLALAYATP